MCYIVDKSVIANASLKVNLGSSMFEGSMPESTVAPSLHPVQHYGVQTRRFGRLNALSMWGFERYNFHFKSYWIRNNSRPLTSAGTVHHCFIIHNHYSLIYPHSHWSLAVCFILMWHVARSVTVHEAARYFSWKADDYADSDSNRVCRLADQSHTHSVMMYTSQ